MPLQKLEKPGFIYIAYRRDGARDFLELKNVLEKSCLHDPSLRDIIIDLTKHASLTHGEISLLMNFLKDLQGDKRRLMIITNSHIKRKFVDANIHILKNVNVFDNHADFFASLKEPATLGEQSPPANE